jgi:uncharacterized membrane protein YgcG
MSALPGATSVASTRNARSDFAIPAASSRAGPLARLGWIAVLAVGCVLPALAEERILAYDSQVEIRADGSLDVTERITVRAEGHRIRRGIYRDFPTRYRDRHGNRVVVGFEMLEVLRDGASEPWFTEGMSNGVRINTGNDDFLPVPAEYSYTLRYRTTRQLGFFDGHDELYWNAIGTGWAFPIERGEVLVRLPQPVPVERLEAEAYTGPQGARGRDYAADLPAPGSARWRLTSPLAPGEGFTVVLSFPKGIVDEPGRGDRLRWFLADNRGVLVALVALVVLLGYCVRRWHQVGRDPPAGTIIARYEPPEGHSPAGLRFMRRMGHDNRGFSSDLLALAVAGQLRIHRDKRLLKDSWRLERLPAPAGTADEAQRGMLARLFAGGPELQLDNSKASTMQAAQQAHAKALTARYQPAMFRRNGGSIGAAAMIAIAGIVLAFMASGGAGVLAIIAIAVPMLAVVAVFGALVKAPTPAGRRLLDEIEGLRMYLGVAEREELARMPGPQQPPALDAARYERLLPYAVALDVEQAWTRKFTAAVGAAAAAAATSAIGWYHGRDVGDIGRLASAVGDGLSSRVASASTPPGSSSGGGGGGSSGGGGGGGGGGGR